MKIFGLDISLDHGGIVVLNGDGVVVDYGFLSTTKKYIGVDPQHGSLLSKREKNEPNEVFRLRRLKEYMHILLDIERKVSTTIPPTYFSIEGYSYSSKTTSICQIAELTGYLKHLIFEGGGKIRIHDPLTVKLFATGRGNSMKKDVVERALSWLDPPLPKSRKLPLLDGLIKKKQIKKGDKKVEEYDGPATDLADAYFLAKMLYTELKLRSGELELSQLNEGERRIFLRTTKAYPVNILDRPFIQK